MESGRMDYMAMGRRVRERRQEMKVTQAWLAECSDVSVSFIGHIERGEKKPSIETVVRLAEVLNLETDYLLIGRRANCVRSECPLYRELKALVRDYP